MPRIGVIYTSYDMDEYLFMSLNPWIAARKNYLDGNEFVICAVSVPFEGFPVSGRADQTSAHLKAALEADEIDHLITDDTPMRETAARGAALQYLLGKQNCDVIIQVDGDEKYLKKDISAIFKFVADNPFIAWFRISLRNIVFTPNQWLAEPFTPPRVYRNVAPGRKYRLWNFADDNNIAYMGTVTRDIRPDSDFASMTVPPSVAFPAHFTWLNDERSRRKIDYQRSRGWNCSFSWDDSKGGLIFNPDLPAPEIVSAANLD